MAFGRMCVFAASELSARFVLAELLALSVVFAASELREFGLSLRSHPIALCVCRCGRAPLPPPNGSERHNAQETGLRWCWWMLLAGSRSDRMADSRLIIMRFD
jgi:hypothetical protein